MSGGAVWSVVGMVVGCGVLCDTAVMGAVM